MPQVSKEEWKEFIERQSNVHLLQSPEWGELKGAFGWEAARLIYDDLGVQLLFRRLPLGLTVGYAAKASPSILEPEAIPGLWGEIASICRKKRAVFLKVEPDAWMGNPTDAGRAALPRVYDGIQVHESNFNIQPRRTIVVDLRGSEDDILGRMRQKCRYNVRLAEKKGVNIRPWADLRGFHAMTRVTGERDGFHVHSAEYYQRAYDLFRTSDECELLLAEFGDSPLAALMVFRQGERACYLYGASSDAERNRMPTYLLQWEAMRWAKNHGCREYDLWGVPDEEEEVLEANFEARQDGLWGVYRFKRGFGGQLRRAAQAVDFVVNPALYQLYVWRMAGREVD